MSAGMDAAEVVQLLREVTELLRAEPNVLRVDGPVAVVGDIHGQYADLLEIFRISPPPPQQRFVFLGDYVDRGYKSIECILHLLDLKLRYPRDVILLRGNHECRSVTQMYGFYDECLRKYSKAMYSLFMECFDALPLAAIIQDKYFAIHAGISPHIQFISDVEKVNRFCEIPTMGLMTDIVWSDPGSQLKYEQSPRGCGFLFGEEAVDEFLENTQLKCIVRGHQMMMGGFDIQMNGRLITVFSAPNYAFRGGNAGAIMEIDEQGGYELKKFSQRGIEASLQSKSIEYFL